MDRDKRWDRLKLAYDTMVYGKGPKTNDINSLITNSFANNVFDEFIIPTVISENGMISDNDGVIIANYRPDRIIQLGTALTNDSFEGFDTKKINNLKLVTMMPVADSVLGTSAFKPIKLENTLGVYIASLGLKQLRIAETEKYAHVTYFFDGGVDAELEGCKRVLINSPKVATYDMLPEMSVYEVTNQLINELDNDYDVIILNYANCDMVGHTGSMEATIKAIEAVDYNLGLLYNKVSDIGGLLIVVADHGNCEYMLDDDDNIITSHTTNKVPFIICDKNFKLKDGKLGDIAPTILKIMGREIPKEMTGSILIG